MRVKKALILGLLIALAGCENYDLDLHDQVSYKIQEYPRILPPEGSVTITPERVNYEDVDGALLANPYEGKKSQLKLGKALFNTYCIACHGPDGTTKGAPVADKFDPRPTSLTDEVVLSLTEGEIFQRVVVGFGLMPSYKYDVSDREAWAIAEYVLKLQNRESIQGRPALQMRSFSRLQKERFSSG